MGGWGEGGASFNGVWGVAAGDTGGSLRMEGAQGVPNPRKVASDRRERAGRDESPNKKTHWTQTFVIVNVVKN